MTIVTILCRHRHHATQRGTAAVEFALVSGVLFAFVFATIELAHLLYLRSTVAEVVARAARLAAVRSPQDADQVRQEAMFHDATGRLPLGNGIDASYLRIEYLNCNQQAVSPLPTPFQNMLNCTSSPGAANCIRFVRASLCRPGTNCEAVPFTPVVALDAVNKLKVQLPTFATLVAADSLGLPPGNLAP